MLTRFWRDERAATAIEYALVAGLISIAIVVGARAVGSTLATRYYGPIANSISSLS